MKIFVALYSAGPRIYLWPICVRGLTLHFYGPNCVRNHEIFVAHQFLGPRFLVLWPSCVWDLEIFCGLLFSRASVSSFCGPDTQGKVFTLSSGPQFPFFVALLLSGRIAL